MGFKIGDRVKVVGLHHEWCDGFIGTIVNIGTDALVAFPAILCNGFGHTQQPNGDLCWWIPIRGLQLWDIAPAKAPDKKEEEFVPNFVEKDIDWLMINRSFS